MRALLFSLLLPLSLLTPACSPQAAENTPTPAATQASVHPVSGLAVIPLTVTTLKGPHAFRVELARSPQEQAQGRMFRTAMGPDEGMLFPYPRTALLSMWMKNTYIPLDMLFIREDGTIASIAANTTPLSEQTISSGKPVAAVLELGAGFAARHGVVPGNRFGLLR